MAQEFPPPMRGEGENLGKELWGWGAEHSRKLAPRMPYPVSQNRRQFLLLPFTYQPAFS